MNIYFVVFFYSFIMYNCSQGDECPSVSGGCCSGYHRDTDGEERIECPEGYFGINCSNICDNGYYGQRCLHRCNCQTEEICDYVEGCIRYIETTVDLSTGVASTEILIKSSTSELGDSAGATTEDIEEIKSSDQKITLNNIILIGIPTISVAFNIVLVLIVIKRRRRPCLSRRNTKREIETSQDQVSRVPGVYDYVDGNVVARLFQSETDPIVSNTQDDRGSSSSSDDIEMNVLSEDTSGYLNPYQPLQAEWQKHTHVYSNTDEMMGYLQSSTSLHKGHKDKTTQTESEGRRIKSV